MERKRPLDEPGEGFWRSLSSREVPVNSHFDERDSEPAADLARRLGLSFSRVALLTRAMTHRSYVNEHSDAQEDNERLEFLGDAVLDFIVGAWVYQHFPEMPEGDLTKVRSAFVCNEQLAVFARKFDLGQAMRLGRGELTSGGRDRDGLLGCAFEALIGALYLDAGLGAVDAFIHPLLVEVRDPILSSLQDPKSEFQEWTQAEKIGTPRYKVVLSTGPDHARIFDVEVVIGERVFGQGRGSSKQAAERAAAADALEKINR
jgi:ribonuclease-3